MQAQYAQHSQSGGGGPSASAAHIYALQQQSQEFAAQQQQQGNQFIAQQGPTGAAQQHAELQSWLNQQKLTQADAMEQQQINQASARIEASSDYTRGEKNTMQFHLMTRGKALDVKSALTKNALLQQQVEAAKIANAHKTAGAQTINNRIRVLKHPETGETLQDADGNDLIGTEDEKGNVKILEAKTKGKATKDTTAAADKLKREELELKHDDVARKEYRDKAKAARDAMVKDRNEMKPDPKDPTKKVPAYPGLAEDHVFESNVIKHMQDVGGLKGGTTGDDYGKGRTFPSEDEHVVRRRAERAALRGEKPAAAAQPGQPGQPATVAMDDRTIDEMMTKAKNAAIGRHALLQPGIYGPQNAPMLKKLDELHGALKQYKSIAAIPDPATRKRMQDIKNEYVEWDKTRFKEEQ